MPVTTRFNPLTIHFEGRDGIKVKATRRTWVFRDGAVERIVLYQELHEALEAAGCRSRPVRAWGTQVALGMGPGPVAP